jgi:hypothetical protein
MSSTLISGPVPIPLTEGSPTVALNLTAIPAGKGTRKPLDDIDPELVETIEEAFEFCKADDSRLQTPDFASRQDAEDWLSDARAYAYHRGTIDGKERVTVAGNPAKGTGTNAYVVRFRVEKYVGKPDAE